eukprot:g4557.t1
MKWRGTSMLEASSNPPEWPKFPMLRLSQALLRVFRDRKLVLKSAGQKFLYCANKDVLMLSPTLLGGFTGLFPFQRPQLGGLKALVSSPAGGAADNYLRAGGRAGGTTSSSQRGKSRGASTTARRRTNKGSMSPPSVDEDAEMTEIKAALDDTGFSSSSSGGPGVSGALRSRYYDRMNQAIEDLAGDRFRVDAKRRAAAPLMQCRRQIPKDYCVGRYRCGLERVEPLSPGKSASAAAEEAEQNRLGPWDVREKSYVRVPRDTDGLPMNTFDIVIPEYHKIENLPYESLGDGLVREVAFGEGARLDVGKILSAEVENFELDGSVRTDGSGTRSANTSPRMLNRSSSLLLPPSSLWK